jgi:hypothetical protein
MSPQEEAHFIQLWQAGTETAAIAQALGIPRGTVGSRAATLVRQGKIAPRPRGGAYPHQQVHTRALPAGTPPDRTRHTRAHPGTPPVQDTGAHPGTPIDPTAAHSGTPAVSPWHTGDYPSTPEGQPTPAHSGVPMPQDLAVRLLSLLPDLEVMVARERDRQRLVSTPLGTPQHTVKKTYVVDTLYVDLIERYAQAEGLERKDVVNLAFHEFFERRQYLPSKE